MNKEKSKEEIFEIFHCPLQVWADWSGQIRTAYSMLRMKALPYHFGLAVVSENACTLRSNKQT